MIKSLFPAGFHIFLSVHFLSIKTYYGVIIYAFYFALTLLDGNEIMFVEENGTIRPVDNDKDIQILD